MANNAADGGEFEDHLVLYAEEVWNGQSKNEIDVLSAKGSNELGRAVFFDWPVHDELIGGQLAQKTVGRVRGVSSKVSFTDSMFHRSFCIMLTDPKYLDGANNEERSTLAVMGLWEKGGGPTGSASAAIVGGTGKYTLARGVVYVKYGVKIGSTKYIELNAHVLYQPMPESDAP